LGPISQLNMTRYRGGKNKPSDSEARVEIRGHCLVIYHACKSAIAYMMMSETTRHRH
jgi:hypothetical protein